MKILAIETSCDETGISIIDASGDAESFECNVLANELLSQANLHAEYGGVYPNLAKREHIKNLPILLEHALENASLDDTDKPVDCIAITHGPGLAPALWTGVNFAVELSKKWSASRRMPIVPVNHMEGHVFSALLKKRESINYQLSTINFPAIALLVSGGHTELLLMKDWFEYELLGSTRDDAVGEAFDKVARLLGLPYPGGPEISKLAQAAREEKLDTPYTLPRPMIDTDDYDFSFAGLKTAVLTLTKKLDELNEMQKKQIAKEFEDAAADVLTEKMAHALASAGAKTLIIGGGVAANSHINERIAERLKQEHAGVELHAPEKGLTGDNALMIAVAGYFRARRGEYVDKEKLEAKANLTLHNNT